MLHTICMEHFLSDKKENKGYTELLRTYVICLVGTLTMAVGVVVYFEPLGLVTGGVTGLGIILDYVWNLPVWLVNLVVNLPLFVMGYRSLGRQFFIRSFFCTVALTVFLAVIPPLAILTGDYLIDALCGGVWMGLGLGLIFSQNASSGGADLLASMLNKRFAHVSVPKLLAIVDGIIIISGIGVFSIRNGIYAFWVLYLITRISDAVIEGPNRAKLMYIITEKHRQIEEYITKEVGRGVTRIPAKGGYTHESRPMLLCTLSKQELIIVKQKLYKIDKNAICFVGDIREAYGEGFTNYSG